MQISPEQAREIAAEVVQGDVWASPAFYLTVLAISLVASIASALLTSYFSKRGETLATKTDFEEILRQVRLSTAAAEQARAEIQDQFGVAATARQILRERLELILAATFDLEHWLEQARSRGLRGESSEISGSPLTKIEALCLIYFPEAAQELHDLKLAYFGMSNWIIELQQEYLTATRERRPLNQPNLEEFGNLQRRLGGAITDLRTKLIARARERGAL
jgi:hypothetical protein